MCIHVTRTRQNTERSSDFVLSKATYMLINAALHFLLQEVRIWQYTLDSDYNTVWPIMVLH